MLRGPSTNFASKFADFSHGLFAHVTHASVEDFMANRFDTAGFQGVWMNVDDSVWINAQPIEKLSGWRTHNADTPCLSVDLDALGFGASHMAR